MNLAEALIAVPELPTQRIAKRRLKLNPDLVVREEANENGEPIAVVFVPEHSCVYRIPQTQFELLKLFDGERSYQQVAEEFQAQTGVSVSEEQVKEIAGTADDTGLWYVSTQERNITLSQKLSQERRKRSNQRGKRGDLSHMSFRFWDPDSFLVWVDRHFGLLYSRWFTWLTLFLFAVMAWIWIERWSEIGRDTVLYYTFTDKNGWDILEFWVLFLIMGFLHESAHGLTCKHFGGNCHNIGFQLIYLTPAFAADITEVWVRTGKWQRIAAIMAGIWIETLVCALATLIWVGTPSGSYVHEIAYKFMLITGVMVVVMNLNPLIKLDGYYALAEVSGIPDLKEKSTAFLSGWVKRQVFRLPVEVDYVPPKRRLFYVPYAFLSGMYSYVLLFALARFSFNVLKRVNPQIGLLVAAVVAWLIFRSRIKRLGAFMKIVYLDKQEKLAMTPARWVLAAAVLVFLFAAPIFRKTASGLFVLEPVRQAAVRAYQPGMVGAVWVREGEAVPAGAPLVTLRNVNVTAEAMRADATLDGARMNRTQTQLAMKPGGAAIAELERAASVSQEAHRQLSALEYKSPIAGVVSTRAVEDEGGRYVAAGTLLVEVQDTSGLRARLFVPEYEVRELRLGESVALHAYATAAIAHGIVQSIAAEPAPPAPGLVEDSKYKGLSDTNFYAVEVLLKDAESLKPGMAGEAKVLVRRWSILAMLTDSVRSAAERWIW